MSATDRRLSLFKSNDGGKTWPWIPFLELPTLLDGRGSIAMGADCKTLSVVWDARDPNPAYSSVHYGELDTTTGVFDGPTLLAEGTSLSGFSAMDVECTLGGRVAVIYMRSYASSQNAWFNGNWSSTIRVKQPNASAFGVGQAINTGTFAFNANMVAIGDDVHITYREATGDYGICYRGFDTRGESFLNAADVPIGPANNAGMHASNIAVIATDNIWARECDLACLHVVYATGDSNLAGNGKIWHAWAPVSAAGTSSGWNRTLVMNYPELKGGNYTYPHYTLATGEDRTVYVLFKTISGVLTSINQQSFVCGTAGSLVGLFPSTQGVPGINGHRGSNTMAKKHFMFSREGTLEGVWMWRARSVDLVSGRAHTVAYGRTCELALDKQPTLRSRNTPTIGGPPFVLEASGLVNSMPAVMMAGTSCISSVLGGSCWILQNNLLTLAIAPVTGCGQTVTALVVPNNPALIETCLYFQALQYAPGWNLFSNFIATNGLLAVLDDA